MVSFPALLEGGGGEGTGIDRGRGMEVGRGTDIRVEMEVGIERGGGRNGVWKIGWGCGI